MQIRILNYGQILINVPFIFKKKLKKHSFNVLMYCSFLLLFSFLFFAIYDSLTLRAFKANVSKII